MPRGYKKAIKKPIITAQAHGPRARLQVLQDIMNLMFLLRFKIWHRKISTTKIRVQFREEEKKCQRKSAGRAKFEEMLLIIQ